MIARKPGAVVAAAMLVITTRHTGATDAALQRCLAHRAEQDAFSGVIAAAEDGRPIASVARGRRAGDGSAAITARTRFNLASASKIFTAVAIGQLIDAGRIRLDEPIGAFVEGLEPETAAVSIRQLLTHTSGLGDFFKPENMMAMLKARTASDLLPLVAHEKPAFAPGSRFAYSNSGFALLGILIERVSRLTYGDYLARNVFAPAHMTDTGLDPKPLATLAVGMTAMRTGMVPAPGATEGYGSPAGGLFSTAADMEHFARAFLEDRLTSAATAAALTTPHIVAAPATAARAERDYGFGFSVGVENGQKWFGHNGGTLGANTEFAVFPERRLILCVLSNRDPPMASAMFGYLKKLVLDPSLRASCGMGEK
jgi:CubicO group peptidase (beta-lactamase class C family)